MQTGLLSIVLNETEELLSSFKICGIDFLLFTLFPQSIAMTFKFF